METLSLSVNGVTPLDTVAGKEVWLEPWLAPAVVVTTLEVKTPAMPVEKVSNMLDVKSLPLGMETDERKEGN